MVSNWGSLLFGERQKKTKFLPDRLHCHELSSAYLSSMHVPKVPRKIHGHDPEQARARGTKA